MSPSLAYSRVSRFSPTSDRIQSSWASSRVKAEGAFEKSCSDPSARLLTISGTTSAEPAPTERSRASACTLCPAVTSRGRLYLAAQKLRMLPRSRKSFGRASKPRVTRRWSCSSCSSQKYIRARSNVVISAAKSQSRLRVAWNCIGSPASMLKRSTTLISRQRCWTVVSDSSENTSTTNISGGHESPVSKPNAIAVSNTVRLAPNQTEHAHYHLRRQPAETRTRGYFRRWMRCLHRSPGDLRRYQNHTWAKLRDQCRQTDTPKQQRDAQL